MDDDDVVSNLQMVWKCELFSNKATDAQGQASKKLFSLQRSFSNFRFTATVRLET